MNNNCSHQYTKNGIVISVIFCFIAFLIALPIVAYFNVSIFGYVASFKHMTVITWLVMASVY